MPLVHNNADLLRLPYSVLVSVCRVISLVTVSLLQRRSWTLGLMICRTKHPRMNSPLHLTNQETQMSCVL